MRFSTPQPQAPHESHLSPVNRRSKSLDEKFVVLGLVVRGAILVVPGISDLVPYAGRSVSEPVVEPGRIGVVCRYTEARLTVAARPDQLFGRGDQRGTDPATAVPRVGPGDDGSRHNRGRQSSRSRRRNHPTSPWPTPRASGRGRPRDRSRTRAAGRRRAPRAHRCPASATARTTGRGPPPRTPGSSSGERDRSAVTPKRVPRLSLLGSAAARS